MHRVALFAALCSAAAMAAEPAAPADRPTMRQLATAGGLATPPSARELVDARAELKARFREPLAHTDTAAGASLAVEIFLDAAAHESGMPLKWLLLDEARRLGASVGNADAIKRSIAIASATFDFDELETELESLEQIPLRALDPRKAAMMASAAASLADRAAADGRRQIAVDAQMLAVRSWQRAGNREAAKAAAARHDELAK